MEIPALEAGRMKELLRLYPRSWRRRYGREMEVLLDDIPGEIGVGLDLVLGAGAAYAAVIRGNRILGAAGSYLHGVCMAVLLQATAFVAFVLIAETSRNASTVVQLGPMQLVAYERPEFFGLLSSEAVSLFVRFDWFPAAVVLIVLLGALAFLVTAPRMMRSPR
jgi:hypothetical protein